MKQTLVIGSTVVDVILNLPGLPGRGEDINIGAPLYRVGGCAYNVYQTLSLFESPALLCSPVGTGIYGRMVREHFEREGRLPFVSLDAENGCCYCLVEPDGERSFLSHHGAEYLFSRSWMSGVDYSQIDGIYISGIEVEDPSGAEIVEFVYEHPEPGLYFAPGPRIARIQSERMERLFRRRDANGKGPLLHLNESEALCFAGEKARNFRPLSRSGAAETGDRGRVEAAADFLAEKTKNAVVITQGERGAYCLSGPGAAGRFIPGFPANVVDTVGAGDSHCGALIACLKKGMSLEDACLLANRIGAAVVGARGAVPDKLQSALAGMREISG